MSAVWHGLAFWQLFNVLQKCDELDLPYAHRSCCMICMCEISLLTGVCVPAWQTAEA